MGELPQVGTRGIGPRASPGVFLALEDTHAGVRLQRLLKAKEDPKKNLGRRTGKKGIDSHTPCVV